MSLSPSLPKRSKIVGWPVDLSSTHGEFLILLHNPLMAFETRRSKFYFYWAKRRGKRVIKVYCGGGLAGELAAEQHAAFRQERCLFRAKERATLLAECCMLFG